MCDRCDFNRARACARRDPVCVVVCVFAEFFLYKQWRVRSVELKNRNFGYQSRGRSRQVSAQMSPTTSKPVMISSYHYIYIVP